MIGRRVQGIKTMVLILNLRPVRHHKAELAKALHDILCHLSKRMKLPQAQPPARRGEIRGLCWGRRSQFNPIPGGLKRRLELAFGRIDGLAGKRPLFLG